MLPINWPALSIAESDARPDVVGGSVVDLAEERGVTPLDAMLDIALEDGLRTRFNSVVANNDEEGIAWLLPATMSCSASPARVRTSASSATRASRPTCSATGCATAT
jgi:N-acyl-D-aspartate/D-glutamate deacylase